MTKIVNRDIEIKGRTIYNVPHVPNIVQEHNLVLTIQTSEIVKKMIEYMKVNELTELDYREFHSLF